MYNKNPWLHWTKMSLWTLLRGSNNKKSTYWHYFCHEIFFLMNFQEGPPIVSCKYQTKMCCSIKFCNVISITFCNVIWSRKWCQNLANQAHQANQKNGIFNNSLETILGANVYTINLQQSTCFILRNMTAVVTDSNTRAFYSEVIHSRQGARKLTGDNLKVVWAEVVGPSFKLKVRLFCFITK
jgi:hypothetical protein